MSCQTDINVKFIHQRCKYNSICSRIGVRMRLTGTIDITVENNYLPFCIRITLYCFCHQCPVFFLISVITV